MRVGAVGDTAPLLGQLQRAVEVLAKDGFELGGGRLAVWIGPRLSEVVLGGHRTLLEERVDPERSGGQTIRRRMRRVRRYRLAERRERGVAIEVVAQELTARAKRRRLGRARGGGRSRGQGVAPLAGQGRNGSNEHRRSCRACCPGIARRAHIPSVSSVAMPVNRSPEPGLKNADLL